MRLRLSVALSSIDAAASAAAGATLVSRRARLLLPMAVQAACTLTWSQLPIWPLAKENTQP